MKRDREKCFGEKVVLKRDNEKYFSTIQDKR
jgi:hypothetical protein